jgi:methionyl-tRNA synthetase
MEKDTFYITTAIPYVNSYLHLGNVYEAILADACARYHRIKGDETFFLTGTDEHGQKIYKSAQKSGINPQQFVDRMSAEVRRLWDYYCISYDDFIRTTEPRHEKVVQRWFERSYANGDIYLGKYEGWYCVECETFYMESQIVDNRCPDCSRPVEKLEEENYFFRLSKYQQPLLEHIDKNPDFVIPEIRRNEVIGLLKQGLNDISVTRTAMSWGVSIPFDTKHVSYVWVDALINYISATGVFFDEDRFNKLWPVDFHLIGKDILKFHAVIWPAMLLSAGLELPKCVAVHGWLLAEDIKMSKSKGNVLDPYELAEIYGVDALRYFLLKEISFGLDGSFSHELMTKTFNSDLSNDIGNLLSRSLAMVSKYRDGRIPRPSVNEAAESQIIESWQNLQKTVDEFIKWLDFRNGLDSIWSFINDINKYVDSSAPWALARDSANSSKLDTVLYTICESLRLIAMLVFPVIPSSAQKIWDQLGINEDISNSTLPANGKWGLLKPGTVVGERQPIFPRIEKDSNR